MTEDIETKEVTEIVNEDINEKHLIGSVIDNFLHRVQDIEECAQEFIVLASKRQISNCEQVKAKIVECREKINCEDNANKNLIGMKELRSLIRESDRLINSTPAATIEKSLFIYLFSALDKFVGDLVSVLYQANASLYKNISREIALSEALKFESMDELRAEMLNKEIETLRRKGYSDQFKDLEKRFSIKLTKFESWSYFIECSQRRNLFTHCDGVVSPQYIEICQDLGVKFKVKPVVGQQLNLGASYFFQSCLVVSNVATMLGHTLWRKIVPSDLNKADSHLNDLIFNYMHMEKWAKSISACKFALGLPKISNEQLERLFTINYAISLMAIDKSEAAKHVLDKKDWSATTFEFRLAYAVLTSNYSDALELMKKIGENGELIHELAYHDWPLFRNFRDSGEFLEGYLSVYGYNYLSKLSTIAEEKILEVKEVEAEIIEE